MESLENLESKIVLSVLRNCGKKTRDLITVCEKDFEEYEFNFFEKAKELNLVTPISRFDLFWKIDNFIERAIYENSYLDNYELNSYTVEEWNKEKKIKIDADLVAFFLSQKGLKLDSEKRAFLALCDGDVETYKLYQKEKPKILINMLVRYLMSHYENRDKVIDSAKEVMDKLFGDIYSTEVEDTYNKLFGMLKKFQRQNVVYRKSVKPKDFIFSKGLKTIINPYITIEVNGEEGVQKSIGKNMDNNNSNKKLNIEEDKNEKEAAMDVRLREKTAYLENQINVLSKKLEEAREGAVIDLIRKIAGKGAGYQLSELFMETTGEKESDREIIAGKLVNLFSMLELEEIYAYASGRNIGDKFTISKSDLAKKYMVTDPIRSNEELIKVELVHYGWNYKNKQIVMPLVKEVL